MNANRDDLHTCESCTKEFSHHDTNAVARFDFCSAACESRWWEQHPTEKQKHPYWKNRSAQVN